MCESITIAKQFCGPIDSGNGGYVCGLLARYIDGTAEVMLKKPPPLEQALSVERSSSSFVLFKNGDVVVAQGESAVLDLEVPVPPTLAEAEKAATRYIGFEFHPYPRCFVCGPERSVGDGMRIFPGLVEGRDILASPWKPHESLADENGYVKQEFLWACLDCPGAFAVIGKRPVLLGKLTAQLTGRIRPEENCVVMGWKIARDGRKLHAGTAIFSQAGEIIGKARAIWIELGNNT